MMSLGSGKCITGSNLISDAKGGYSGGEVLKAKHCDKEEPRGTKSVVAEMRGVGLTSTRRCGLFLLYLNRKCEETAEKARYVKRWTSTRVTCFDMKLDWWNPRPRALRSQTFDSPGPTAGSIVIDMHVCATLPSYNRRILLKCWTNC
jgi:hypothetical protein